MGKNIILNESQFKDIMRKVLHENANDDGMFIDYDDMITLLHKMIDNDFYLYFSNGRVFNCNSMHEKGEIFYAVCTGHPRLMPNGRIGLSNKNYGYFEMENLLDPDSGYGDNDEEY